MNPVAVTIDTLIVAAVLWLAVGAMVLAVSPKRLTGYVHSPVIGLLSLIAGAFLVLTGDGTQLPFLMGN